MAELDAVYPPSPEHDLKEVTRPTPGYRFRVILVLVGLIAFVLLYLGLILGAAYWAYWAFGEVGADRPRAFRSRRSDPTVFFLFQGVTAVVLFLYLVKGLFKRSRSDSPANIEITEQDQPLLFAFIRRLCRETNAPFPYRVFVNYEVNAAVFYNQSFFSLFWPTPKNLLLGLGLVNRLNLSEFKAVLAHEFGHFSQSSMKLGTYVYTANRTIADIVYGRDWLDDLIDGASRIDFRIAVFAWAFKAILWVLRKFLELLFKAINFAHSALSRQMEFNADLVAYSVTGSDALVHALAKLDFANEALLAASRELFHAGDHQLYTKDLFYHQTRNLEHLRKVRKEPRRGEPPSLPDDPSKPVQVFEPGDHGIPLMWATHPSNFDREANAKRHYLRSTLDERPGWVLFRDAEALREEVTRRYYEVVHKLPAETHLSPPEEVQAFFDAEHAEMTYDERYHGIYDEGFIAPGELDPLMKEAPSQYADAGVLEVAQAGLFDDEVRAHMEGYRRRRKEYGQLYGLANGFVNDKTFTFREAQYPAKRAAGLLEDVRKELEVDQKWLEGFDRTVFKVHYAMALQLGGDWPEQLVGRYKFHLGVQELLNQLQNVQQQVQGQLDRIAGLRTVEQELFQHVLGVLRGAREFLVEKLRTANNLRIPLLKNMEPGQLLGTFLWQRALPTGLPANTQSLDGKLIGELLSAFGEVLDKSRRIHLKSLGGILTLQESIAAKWREARQAGTLPQATFEVV